ncbi:MAG: hypothetical protein SV375_00125 [Thermodesulfobacteriota bacterium]|nr:hypothetical protein [Thermodesulfobacteriota bacterium]
MYKLRKGVESYQVVDGPFAGRKILKGETYRKDQIPPGDEGKFMKKAEGGRLKVEGGRLKVEGGRLKEEGRRFKVETKKGDKDVNS